MYDKLIFFNHFGAGDLFESREFVKDIMKQIPAQEYYYAHGKNPRMFDDIRNLKYMPIDETMNAMTSYQRKDNYFYLNTWIGRDGFYVLPQIGCTLGKNWDMFNDILNAAGEPLLSSTYLNYLPTVDYSKFQTKGVNHFINRNKSKYKVLICNGSVQSLQAFNFSFAHAIHLLAQKYKDIVFIITEPIESQEENVYPVSFVTDTTDKFDLNEISYLAQFVDVIVGRKSGPAVFAHPKEVWYDGNKKSLSFTYGKQASHFVLEDNLPLKKYWSPSQDEEEVFRVIEECING